MSAATARTPGLLRAVVLGSITACRSSYSMATRLAIGRWGYGRLPRSRAESPTICHTSCHTELDLVGKESASSGFCLVGGTGIEPVAPAV